MPDMGTTVGLINSLTAGVKEDVAGKLEAPSTAGTSGQVLVSDGNGGQVWGDIDAGEVVIDSTLSVAGAAADAKACGDLKTAITNPFYQNIDGWTNKGIAPSTGAITANSKRLMAQIPYTALTCKVDSGYSYLVYGWNGSTYLGWYTGTDWSKNSMVMRTDELDLSAIRSYTLYAVVLHGTTTGNAVNINTSESIHFYTKNKTDSLLKVKNVPADSYAVGTALNNNSTGIRSEVKTITGNEVLNPTVFGYIKTSESTVDVTAIVAADNLYNGVFSCTAGEKFTVKGSNPGTVVNYCTFVDSSYNVLSREAAHNDYTVITAPASSAYIIVQRDISNNNNSVIRGRLLDMTVNGLVSDVADISDIVGGYRSPLYYTSDDTQALVTSYNTLIGMYDALVTANPDYITKNTLTHENFTNYEYVFTMGDRNGADGERTQDASSEKPVVLIMAGVHGHERCSIVGLYLFAKALCESPELSAIRNSLTIKMIPCVCPSGYNNNSRTNANGVNINRNFDANWVQTEQGQNYSGAAAADQDETQVVQAWMDANTDAVLEIDWHNSGFTNEICYFATCVSDGFAVNAKKGFFYGMDRIVSHWINDRQFGDSDTIYYYTGTDYYAGTSYAYAKKINLCGSLFETAYEVEDLSKDSNATIGVGIEAFCAAIKGINAKYIDA